MTARAPAANAACASSAVASAWPTLTMTPAAARREIRSFGTAQGASVTTIAPDLGGDQAIRVVGRHRPDELRRMRALAADVDERPLHMNAEDAGRARCASPAATSAAASFCRRVGDDGRQQRSRAVARDAPRRWRATPSGVGASLNSTPPPPLTCQSIRPGASTPPPRSQRSPPRGALRGRRDGDDRAVIDDERVIVDACARRRTAARPKTPSASERPHHLVSVILRRCGGLSGSRPSARAQASTRP